MQRYKLKIERKFNESYVNATFKMPRIKTQSTLQTSPNNLRFGPADSETALILQQQRCRSQLDPVPNTTKNYQVSPQGSLISPASTVLMQKNLQANQASNRQSAIPKNQDLMTSSKKNKTATLRDIHINR